MKKILVTTDFSTKSKAGIRFAILLANQALCNLIFYHVNAPKAMDAWTQLDYNNIIEAENILLNDKLNQFIKKIYKQTGKHIGKIDCVVESNAGVDASIIAYAEECNADYICMSTRGGGIINKFMGTNASSLIATSPIPLLIVPHTYRMKPLQSILYASDMEKIGSELKSIEKFASAFDATIAVYHYDYLFEEDEVKFKLNKIADKYSSDKIAFHFRKFYADLTLLSQLQEGIRASKPSIIAMFTEQNRDWFERLFVSSKTAEFGFDTKTPLLVYRKTI